MQVFLRLSVVRVVMVVLHVHNVKWEHREGNKEARERATHTHTRNIFSFPYKTRLEL